MTRFHAASVVGKIVAERPDLARVFEAHGVDYCCGGKRSVQEACQARGLDLGQLLEALHVAAAEGGEPHPVDPATLSLSALADHIEQTHHRYLRREFPRLDTLTEKVARVHGEKEPRLREVRRVVLQLTEELMSHMLKEERILFPMIRALDTDGPRPEFHCGTIAHPILQMEVEHDDAGASLAQLQTLTDNFTPPAWACTTYRLLVDALKTLQQDLHQHIHKENNILFPRALQLEAAG
ncbi:MAG: iron-sulfur cluster repair di-iron protein [Deltaproteobacteria bacterium]|nr:iron-sulfur cluster repair di-iron protein [Deltaproteobacteria bacterium]